MSAPMTQSLDSYQVALEVFLIYELFLTSAFSEVLTQKGLTQDRTDLLTQFLKHEPPVLNCNHPGGSFHLKRVQSGSASGT